MPRSGPGPVTCRPDISSVPSEGVSNPATIRNRVDLPQPEGPIRQTNSPLVIRMLASERAVIVSPPKAKRFVTPCTSRIGGARSVAGAAAVTTLSMLRAPAQQAASDRLDRLVGEEAEHADGDHAADDDLGAG